MFAQNPFNNTNVNSLLSPQNRVFGAVNSPNTISTFFSKGGAYAGKQRYAVTYSSPTGRLQGRATDTIHQAVSDARSGQRSHSKDFKFVSYWSKDASAAMSYGAPAGLATDGGTPEPIPMPLPAPSPTPPSIDTPVEDNTDTETGDPSDDPNAQEDESTESGEDISTLSDTTELVETEKEVRPAFILLPIIALAGIGYYTYSESKKK